MHYIGIDLGTSACKFLLTDEKGNTLNIVSEEYPLEFPQPGWSQQEPADWWKAVKLGIPKLLDGFNAEDVAGIGCGGQMHGLVVLDDSDEVIRPAILWNDGRTQLQTEYLNNEIGKEILSERTANIAFAGFTAPKLLWMKESEPELFAKIAKIMLPKDYINYKLTGIHCTDYSDGGFHLMGCILSAASCNKWWIEEILKTNDYSGEQAPITEEKLGHNDVYYLPYLMGERSPHNDPSARGAFLGLRMDTAREDMTQAVMEGVAFAFRDCLDIARAQGIEVNVSRVCGGGAKSSLWRRILSNVLGITLELPQTEQGPGYGAAMLASVACGEYPDVITCARALTSVKETTVPEPALVKAYEAKYQVWKKIYPALKGIL